MRRTIVAVECDGDCRTEVRSPDERGGGVQWIRSVLGQVGWVSDQTADTDLCPRCNARRRAGEWGVHA